MVLHPRTTIIKHGANKTHIAVASGALVHTCLDDEDNDHKEGEAD